MRRGLALIALAVAIVGAHAVPPIITVKNVKTKTGPAFTWDVTSRVVTPLEGPLYPGQSGVAKVAVDVARTRAGQGYLVTGKIIVTNPAHNSEALDVTGLKMAWGPVIPLVTPLPSALDDCAGALQAGESLSCSFKLEAATSILRTLTPIVLVRGFPQLQGDVLALEWPAPAEAEPVAGGAGQQPSDATGCALVQNQVVAGDMQPVVKVSSSEDQADLMTSGLEVCSDSASFTYDLLLGPISDTSALCGPYQIKDLPQVRLASGSIGSSNIKPLALPVSVGGCRQKDILGVHKPAVAISKLTLAQVTTHAWEAEAVSSTNTSSPARVRASSEHSVDVAVQLTKKDKDVANMLVGEVTVTNTEKLPYVLPQQGVRVALSREGSADKQYVHAVCPLVGNTIVVSPQVGASPGTQVCTFRAPVSAAWSKGLIQAQLQTLLSATYEVDSGLPQPYDFAVAASVTPMAQGECVSVTLTRVSDPADLAAANSNAAVASLAKSLGGDAFKLLPMGTPDAAGGRMPPTATDVMSAPYIVCESERLAWRESYGPFSDLDCGTSMALMGFTARPTSGPSSAATATLAFPMAIQGCAITPEIQPVATHAKINKVYKWKPEQTRTPEGDADVQYSQTESFRYTVSYKRSASLSGYHLSGLFKVFNPHAAEMVLESVQYIITRPDGQPIKGEATCSSSVSEQASIAAFKSSQRRAQHRQAGALQWKELPTSGDGAGDASAATTSAAAGASPRRQVHIRLPARHATAAAAASKGGRGVVAQVAEGTTSGDYEDGDGPLFCTFEADLPDDYAADVILVAVTDQGAKATKSVGPIDWDAAQTVDVDKCAMASFTFNAGKGLTQPSKIEGTTPPALAVQICEPASWTFSATFGSWAVTQCGRKHVQSVATVSLPSRTEVISDENKLEITVVGCPGPLPTVHVDATQAQVKCTYAWSIVRRLAAVGRHTHGVEPVVTVAGPGAPTSEPAVLSLAARYSAVPVPGAYAKFNQTITLKRSKAIEHKNKFEVKGEVKLQNDAGIPLKIANVVVKVACDSKRGDPVTVKAVCPEKYYKFDADSGTTVLELPTTATKAHPVKCHYGALVPGPGAVTVNAVAIMADGRKALAKHKVHLELDADYFKPISLGACLRVTEAQAVLDSLTGSPAAPPLIDGQRIPPEGVEVCTTTTYSFVGRIGPLKDIKGEGCQAVTYTSKVEGTPTSGYQSKLANEGVVEVQTKTCKGSHEQDEEEEGDGASYGKHQYDSYEEEEGDKGYYDSVSGGTAAGSSSSDEEAAGAADDAQQTAQDAAAAEGAASEGEAQADAADAGADADTEF